MATSSSFNKAFELPKLRKILKTSLDNPDSEANHFWDAKFYPFDLNREAPPVFALNNKKNIVVCRISPQEDNDIEVIRVFAIKEKTTSVSTTALALGPLSIPMYH